MAFYFLPYEVQGLGFMVRKELNGTKITELTAVILQEKFLVWKRTIYKGFTWRLIWALPIA